MTMYVPIICDKCCKGKWQGTVGGWNGVNIIEVEGGVRQGHSM